VRALARMRRTRAPRPMRAMVRCALWKRTRIFKMSLVNFRGKASQEPCRMYSSKDRPEKIKQYMLSDVFH
jgi:hypothetical protein